MNRTRERLRLATVLALCTLGLLLPASAAAHAAEPILGYTETFWVEDWSTEGGSDTRVTASIQYLGDHVAVYVQEGQTIPPHHLAAFGAAFDQTIYPTLVEELGAEPNPGLDGEPRVVILLYAFNDPDHAVIGYFDPEDVDPHVPVGPGNRDDNDNHREMFYIDSETVAFSPQDAQAASAHEFAHLILYYRDYLLDPRRENVQEDMEERWVQEGVAMYSELICGYAARGQGQIFSFEHSPNLNLTYWRDYLADYGCSYAFMAYLAERAPAGFVKRLVDEKKDGAEGIDAALVAAGASLSFDSVFNDWVLANFLDKRSPEFPPFCYSSLEVGVYPENLISPLPRVGYRTVKNRGAVYLDCPPVPVTSFVRAVVDGEDGAPLRAALISWDSTGSVAPMISNVVLAPGTMGGAVTGPFGFDRHTLVVWAGGPAGLDTSYGFRFSLDDDVETPVQFLDVGAGDLYYPYISSLLARGAISGKEVPAEGSGLWYFLPNDPVKRAQFAKMAVEVAGLHTPEVENLGAPTFSDVPPTYEQGLPVAYPFDYVEEAAEAGITTGFDDGRFRPWEPIKRIQLVRMILRAAEAAGKAYPRYRGSEAVFADVSPGSSLYVDVMTAYTNGVLSGSIHDDGKRYFAPWDQATRGHVAKMTEGLAGHLD